MKVIHVPFGFTPDPIGGTEIYADSLARNLRTLGVDAIIAAPSDSSRIYDINGLRIRRYATSAVFADVSELYGAGDTLAAEEFAKILYDEEPDLVHLHAFTAGASLLMVRAAKARGIPVVFTYHTPTVSCPRGTMMLFGREFCDGKIEVARCTGCTLEGHGMHRALATVVGNLSPRVGEWLHGRGLQGGIWTALRMSELVSARLAAFRAMTTEIDHLVAVSNWGRELLLLNGVPAAKVSFSRPGISWTPGRSSASPTAVSGGETKVAFLGRLDPAKGLDVLIRALRSAPAAPLKLDIYGIVQDSVNAAYQQKMLARADGDSRIVFREPIAPAKVVERLREYDFIAIPSTGIEASPLVALEAFAAGVPVIGWNIGGIGEIVHHEVDGLLIEWNREEGWVEALQRVADDAALRARLKAGVHPPRTSAEVAREMLALYESLTDSAAASAHRAASARA
jgi:glycosyltransferase involved in cell wall biosynthesis